MHALPGDAGGIRAGTTKPADVKSAATPLVRGDAEHGLPSPVKERPVRPVAPVVPPGEFRHVDHGW